MLAVLLPLTLGAVITATPIPKVTPSPVAPSNPRSPLNPQNPVAPGNPTSPGFNNQICITGAGGLTTVSSPCNANLGCSPSTVSAVVSTINAAGVGIGANAVSCCSCATGQSGTPAFSGTPALKRQLLQTTVVIGTQIIVVCNLGATCTPTVLQSIAVAIVTVTGDSINALYCGAALCYPPPGSKKGLLGLLGLLGLIPLFLCLLICCLCLLRRRKRGQAMAFFVGDPVPAGPGPIGACPLGAPGPGPILVP